MVTSDTCFLLLNKTWLLTQMKLEFLSFLWSREKSQRQRKKIFRCSISQCYKFEIRTKSRFLLFNQNVNNGFIASTPSVSQIRIIVDVSSSSSSYFVLCCFYFVFGCLLLVRASACVFVFHFKASHTRFKNWRCICVLGDSIPFVAVLSVQLYNWILFFLSI